MFRQAWLREVSGLSAVVVKKFSKTREKAALQIYRDDYFGTKANGSTELLFKKILHNSLTVIKTLNSYIKYVSKVYNKTIILVHFILNWRKYT